MFSLFAVLFENENIPLLVVDAAAPNADGIH
jgi:hypothetical protein